MIGCDHGSFACGDLRVHIVGGPQPVAPRNTQLVDMQGATLLAWEEGDGADTRVRFAAIPDGVIGG